MNKTPKVLKCLISLATSILEGWDIFHLKGHIHSFVLSTSSFLCDIREPRYGRNKMGYLNEKFEIFSNLAALSVYEFNTQFSSNKLWPEQIKTSIFFNSKLVYSLTVQLVWNNFIQGDIKLIHFRKWSYSQSVSLLDMF